MSAAPPAVLFPELPTTDHDFVVAVRREAELAEGTPDGPAKSFQLRC